MQKVLILGGASVHCKLVKAAKELGYYTIVTDYLTDSPAKQMADEAWLINIMDVDSLEKKCRESQVDGIVCGWLDPAQRPYQELCSRLNLPCYGTKEQFFMMTDKHAFKSMCIEHGVDVIPEYSEQDIRDDKVEFPVFVKPVDSRGSRGQSVCYDMQGLHAAIAYAKAESSNGDIIIEKYMNEAHEMQVTYFFVDGKPYLIRTTDSYCGSEEKQLEKVVACAVSPSKYTKAYIEKAHEKVIKMFMDLGYRNGPIFMQGFEDHGTFRFFDPGLRFPGVDYEKVLRDVFQIDFMKAMVQMSITGDCKGLILPEDMVWLKNKAASVLFPTITAGVVGSIKGYDVLQQKKSIVAIALRHQVGNEVSWTYNVNQRSAEVDIVTESVDLLKDEIESVQELLKVYCSDGADMTYEVFDVSRIG